MGIIYLIATDIILAVPTIAYYYKWGIAAPKSGKHSSEKIMKHLERAYGLTAALIVTIPVLLLWYLYVTLLHLYLTIFINTAVIMLILIAVMEYINYYSFENYEKKRFQNVY
ncbi:MAG: hypothetical protein R6U26_02525 [Candidatus Undinarchaeales archaeon]